MDKGENTTQRPHLEVIMLYGKKYCSSPSPEGTHHDKTGLRVKLLFSTNLFVFVDICTMCELVF